MKKSIFIVTALLLSSILLAACARTGTNAEMTPNVSQGGGTNELGTPITGSTPLATQPVGTSATPGVSTPALGVTETVGGSALGSQQPDAGRVSSLLTFDVQDMSGNKIGTVSDLVINLASVRIQYVIVDTAGKEVAVPSALFDFPSIGISPVVGANATPATGSIGTPASGATATPAPGGTSGSGAESRTSDTYLIFRVDPAALDNAPKWDAALIPPLGKSANDWDSSLSTYWLSYVTPTTINGVVTYPAPGGGTPAVGATPAMGTTPAAPGLKLSGKIQGVVLASKVIGMNIADSTDKTIAEIKDIVVNTINWKVLYLVIDYNGTNTSGGFYIPVPPAAFSISTDGQSLTIANADTILSAAPHFSASDFPYTAITDWDKDIKSFWEQNLQTNPYP